MTKVNPKTTKKIDIVKDVLTAPSKYKKERKMKFTDKDHNYIESDEERNEGHVDTRYNNLECEDPDPSLGCDMGIDVQG